MDRAVAAARAAFDEGPWSRTTLAERTAIIARWRDLVIANRDVIAEVITEEMGCHPGATPVGLEAEPRSTLALARVSGWSRYGMLTFARAIRPDARKFDARSDIMCLDIPGV